MGRLTKRGYYKGDIFVNTQGMSDFDTWIESYEEIYPAIEKLAHYEDLEEAGRLVEVIRCDNCLHQQYCKQAQYLGTDGYCSKAELKELEKQK